MKVVLISCASTKDTTAINGKTVAAKDLYQSSLFKKSWEYAQSFGADRIYILSAKHKLLHPDTQIGYYNESLKEKKAAARVQWANDVLASLRKADVSPENDSFIILAGKAYYDKLIGVPGGLKAENCKLPYQGKKIGYILSFLNKELNKK